MLLSEEEFLSLPKGGDRDRKTNMGKKTHKKPHKKQAKPVPESMEIPYCQPTSSRVKVEDLVTDEEDQIRADNLAKELQEDKVPKERHSFWDRPTPPPQFEWMPDPRMPAEWNAMVSDMRTNDWARFKPRGEWYRTPEDDEISSTQEFTGTWYPDNAERERLHAQSVVRLDTPVDEWSTSIQKLRARFDGPKRKQPPDKKPDRKGKGKATDLSEEDYPRLRQQWHDEFHDMVQGVKEVLPPFREVNHEIHLIDENKRYAYHMP